MSFAPPPPPPPSAFPERAGRSTFVTVLAWLLIVGAGLATPLGAVFALLGLGKGGLYATLWVLAASLVFPCLLAAGIGLLKRRNWARLVVVSALGLLAAVELTGLAGVVSTARSLGGGVPGGGAILVSYGIWTLAFLALASWLVFRLTTEPVRGEFR